MLAGVSKTTVSKVINHKDESISQGTKEKILKIMREQNYVPNKLAQGLVTKKTNTIGLLIPDIRNPFFTDISRGAEDFARSKGYNIIFSSTDENCEREIREMFGVKRAVLMTSGTASLTSALIGMGVGPGDEVIIPAYTYIATALAVVSTGAMPVVAEIDETLMLDPLDIENKITQRTKVILPVHMMGYPCDMERIMAVAKKHNLFVLEDACQGNGGFFKGKRLGSIGDAGAFSFNYFKIISAGEGGALLTNNQDIFEKALIYHDSGAIAYFGDQMNGFSTEPVCGTEYRIGEITSAIMREQFKKLDGIVRDLRKNKALLMKEIGDGVEYIFRHYTTEQPNWPNNNNNP